MPETKVQKKKSQGLGGKGGGKKGAGIGQSVLDLQQQMGNEQTVKTVLGPEVPGQFKAMAGKGKGGPLFFATSTYKTVSKLLGTYAAKQGAKSSAWRRGQVGTLDGVLEKWFAKKSKGKTEADKSKRAAMEWLRPKVDQEDSALNGAKSKESTEQVQEPTPTPEPESSWQGGTAPGGDRSGPTIGKRGWKKGSGGGDRGGVVIGGGRTKKKVEKEPEQAPEPTVNDYTQNVVIGDVEDGINQNDEAPKNDYTQNVVIGDVEDGINQNDEPQKKTEYTDVNVTFGDLDDASSVESESIKSDVGGVNVNETVEPKKTEYTEVNATLNDLDDASSVESESIKEEEPKVVAKNTAPPKKEESSSSDSYSVSSTSSETDEPEAVKKLPPQKYFELRPLETMYEKEFTHGGKHLVDIYEKAIEHGPDRNDIAAWLETSFARWKRPTFEKYWDRLVTIFGPKPPDNPDDYKDVDVSSVEQRSGSRSLSTKSREKRLVQKKIDKGKLDKEIASWKALGINWQQMKIKSVSSYPSDVDDSTRGTDTKERIGDERRMEAARALAADRGDPNAITVKKKSTEEERAKYKLTLGSTLMRLPPAGKEFDVKNEEESKPQPAPTPVPLDTGAMVSNASGPGFGIFVMSKEGDVYVGSHKVGIFHHSSFLGGGQVAAAGEMKVVGGKLEMLTNKSGHYKPKHENNMQIIGALKGAGIDPGSYKYRFFPEQPGIKPETFDSADLYELAKRGY
jgi:hypothetical protein